MLVVLDEKYALAPVVITRSTEWHRDKPKPSYILSVVVLHFNVLVLPQWRWGSQ